MTTMNSNEDLAKYIGNLVADTDFDFSKEEMVTTIVEIFDEWRDSADWDVPAYGQDWSEFLDEFQWDVLIQEAEEWLAEGEQEVVLEAQVVIKSQDDIKRYVDEVVHRNVDFDIVEFDVDAIAQELFAVVWGQHMGNLRGSLGSTPVLGEDWSKYLQSFDWNELILEAEENLTGCETS